jgi:hypothetical protein
LDKVWSEAAAKTARLRKTRVAPDAQLTAQPKLATMRYSKLLRSPRKLRVRQYWHFPVQRFWGEWTVAENPKTLAASVMSEY